MPGQQAAQLSSTYVSAGASYVAVSDERTDSQPPTPLSQAPSSVADSSQIIVLQRTLLNNKSPRGQNSSPCEMLHNDDSENQSKKYKSC